MRSKKIKRVARANVFIDEDDLLILNILYKPKTETFNIDNHDILSPFIELSHLKKVLNISHRALLVHLNRLLAYNLINFLRMSAVQPIFKNDKGKYDYKTKVVGMTPYGKEFFEMINKSPYVISFFNKNYYEHSRSFH